MVDITDDEQLAKIVSIVGSLLLLMLLLALSVRIFIALQSRSKTSKHVAT